MTLSSAPVLGGGGTIYCKLFRRVYQSWNYNLARDQGADHSIALVIRYLAWFLVHLFPLSGRRIGSLALGVLCGSPVWRGGSFPGVVDCWPHCNLKSCLKRTVQSECEKHAHTASALPPGKCVCMCSYTLCVFVNLYAWIVKVNMLSVNSEKVLIQWYKTSQTDSYIYSYLHTESRTGCNRHNNKENPCLMRFTTE